jgi:hypothetical protein
MTRRRIIVAAAVALLLAGAAAAQAANRPPHRPPQRAAFRWPAVGTALQTNQAGNLTITTPSTVPSVGLLQWQSVLGTLAQQVAGPAASGYGVRFALLTDTGGSGATNLPVYIISNGPYHCAPVTSMNPNAGSLPCLDLTWYYFVNAATGESLYVMESTSGIYDQGGIVLQVPTTQS